MQLQVQEMEAALKRRAGPVESKAVEEAMEALRWWNGEQGRVLMLPTPLGLDGKEVEEIQGWVRREVNGYLKGRRLACAPPGTVPRLVVLNEDDVHETIRRMDDLQNALSGLGDSGEVVEMPLSAFLDGKVDESLPYFSTEAFNRRHQFRLINLLGEVRRGISVQDSVLGERLLGELDYWSKHKGVFAPSNAALLLRIFAVTDRGALMRVMGAHEEARAAFDAFWMSDVQIMLRTGRMPVPDSDGVTVPVEPAVMLSIVTSVATLSEGELPLISRRTVVDAVQHSALSAAKVVHKRFREGRVDLQAMVDLARAYYRLGVRLPEGTLARMRGTLIRRLSEGDVNDEDVALSFWISRTKEGSAFHTQWEAAGPEKQDW